jgi:winged helix DNA-binding protein
VAERVLTRRELNRATLARQLLLDREPLSPVAVIERLVGMQAQSPQAPYIGIWTRTRDFRREVLEREIVEGRVVRATVMRQTLHLVTRRDYALLRAAKIESSHPDQRGADADRLAPAIRALATSRPLTTADALTWLEREHGLTGFQALRAWRGGRVRAHVLHHHESALWNARGERRFVALEEPEAGDPVEAAAEIIRRYLTGFGPASQADIAAWSMLRMSQIRQSLARLEPLERLRDEHGHELLDVPGATRPDAETLAPARLLPKWDNVLLGYADRTRVHPDQHRRAVISRNGDVAQTFLVDGTVAGIWRLDRGRVVLEPFARLARTARRELEAEAAHLEAFVGG